MARLILPILAATLRVQLPQAEGVKAAPPANTPSLELELDAQGALHIAADAVDEAAVRHKLATALPGALQSPESIGCPKKDEGQGCTTKVSEKIQDVVREIKPLVYSKATHGQAMLRRVNLDDAAKRCPTLRADLGELRRAIAELRRRG